MNKNLLIPAIMLVAAAQSLTAQTKLDENFLLKRFESAIAFDYLQEFSTNFALYVEKMNSRGMSKVAIRFCSGSPMKIAVTKGAIDLSAIYSVFKGYGFFDKDVIVLRSNECISRVNKIAATEIWVINDERKLPPFDERLYSDDINSIVIGGSEVRFVGNRNYVKNAKSLARGLAKTPMAFGSVYIVYIDTRQTSAKAFRRKIISIFDGARIARSRYSIEIMRWDDKLSAYPLVKRNIFPDFHLVTTEALASAPR